MSALRTDALARLNSLGEVEAARALLDCCGSRRWALAVARGRPFASAGELRAAAERAFSSLGEEDWEEALRAHPRLGGPAAGGHQGGRGQAWSGLEQASVGGADGRLLARLAEGNRRYEERFGRAFVTRASGRGPEELVAELERRLGNDPAGELAEAAGRQREITRLRIDRMLSE